MTFNTVEKALAACEAAGYQSRSHVTGLGEQTYWVHLPGFDRGICYWGDAHYPPLFEALLSWVEKGQKPTPAGVAERCRQLRASQPADCRFLPDYVPNALATRIPPR